MTDPSETERLRREVYELLALRDRAVTIAHATIEKRLDGMNEFRSALNDQSKTFVARTELDLRIDPLEHRLRLLEDFKNNMQGRIAVTVALLSIFFVLVNIAIAVFLR